jgi:hypothetical protein
MFGFDNDEIEKGRKANDGPIEKGMFGYSAGALNRERRKGPWWLRTFIIGLELSVLLSGLALCFAFWLTTTPQGLRFALARIIGDAPVAIEIDDVYLYPGVKVTDPETWYIVVKNLDVQQTDHLTDGVRVKARWAKLPVPNVFSAWFNQSLSFEDALVIGLDIHKDDDGTVRTPNWMPKKTGLDAIDIRHLQVWDGQFMLDVAGDESDSIVQTIYGDLHDMRYEPGPRLLSGDGEVFAGHFRSGAIEAEHVIAQTVARDGNLVFDATCLAADGDISLHGVIEHLERRPSVTLQVVATNLAIAQLVERASGTTSPVYGRVSGTIDVHAGGVIPRGGAWMEAELQLVGGIIPLRNRVGGFARDLLRLVPWIEINDREQMVLGATTVGLRLERGAAIIHELRSRSPNDRWISIFGVVDENIDMVVRFVPKNNPGTRAGFGFTIEGQPGDLSFGIAGRYELLPEIFADENGDKLSPVERRQRRKHARLERRDADEQQENP